MVKSLNTADRKLLSPCVDKCCLDENDLCLGCGRSLAEIIGWSKSTANENADILVKSSIRKTQRENELKQRLEHNQLSRN